jgi:hypothetical protein
MPRRAMVHAGEIWGVHMAQAPTPAGPSGGNSGGEKSSGSNTTTTVAIATALITAVTTISVAVVNKGDNKATPAPAPAIVQPTGGQQPAPTNATPAASQPQTLSGPVDVSGQWRNPNSSETIFFTQNGAQIQAQMISPAMDLNVTGSGSVVGNIVQWDTNVQNGYQSVLLSCRGEVNAGNIQGTCTANGQKSPILYVR